MERAVARIDLGALRANCERLRAELVEARLCAVVKADGYGPGYDAGSGAVADSPKARMARTMQRYVDEFERVPVLILPCLVRYRDPNPMEGASIYPACQNLLLAARALGYGG